MNVSFVRSLLMILAIRAIFISPAIGSEFGLSSHRADSSLKKAALVRPSRLRFTKPCPPSASLERVDCCDGGDDDDERMRPAEGPGEACYSPGSPRLAPVDRRPSPSPQHLIARLRC